MNKIIRKKCELKLQINFYYYALSFLSIPAIPANKNRQFERTKEKNVMRREETFKRDTKYM